MLDLFDNLFVSISPQLISSRDSLINIATKLEKRANQRNLNSDVFKNSTEESFNLLQENFAFISMENEKTKILFELALEQLVTDHATRRGY